MGRKLNSNTSHVTINQDYDYMVDVDTVFKYISCYY